jgi:hypothetical protein
MRGPRHAAGARRIAANIAKLPELLPAPRTRTGGGEQDRCAFPARFLTYRPGRTSGRGWLTWCICVVEDH